MGKTVYADQMEAYIYNQMRHVLAQLEYVSPEKKDKNVAMVVSSYEIKIAEKDNEINALLDRLPYANDTLMHYINQKVQELDNEKRSLSEKLLQLSVNPEFENVDRITNYVDKWEELSIEDKQKIVDILIKVIYIGDETIEIEWNI